jgi:nucleotide-binding universal stress UspA family protein
MREVLLPIDREDARANTQADTAVDLFDADSTVAHLFYDFTDNPEGASVSQVGAVRHAADALEDAGFEASYNETGGDPPPETIIETGEELEVDAIVTAGRKRSPAGKALFGSVSQSVILGTDRPVIDCGESPES